MSIQGKLRAVGNFAASFTKKPETDVRESEDVLHISGNKVPEKEWTVLVYGEGRNKLALSTNMAINKMEHVGSDENVNIVVQSTVEPTWRERFAPDMERAGTRRYYITKDTDPYKISSPVVEDLGERVPLNSETLSDFLSWGMKSFPAKHYMVVVKKHGLGFAKDDKYVPLSARDLKDALEITEKNTGKKVDVLSFDSCSMQQMEVGYEIKEHAKLMTGSQEDIYAIDFPYDRIIWGLEKKANIITPEEVGKLIVDAYQEEAPYGMHTAADLTKLREVGIATEKLVDTLIEENIPPNVIYTNMLKSPSMEPQESMRFAFNFRDEEGFLKNIINDKYITSQKVKNAALELRKKLSDSIIHHKIGRSKKLVKDAKGFNLFIPWKKPAESLKDGYEKLKFEKDTHWMKLIDYVFESKDVAASFAEEIKIPEEKLSISQKFGKTVIKNYKKYVSPYLLTACKHTPSCSQYGREAIEKHGLIEGGKMAFMRILSCNAEAEGRYDPVPEVPKDSSEIRCNIAHGPPPSDSKDVQLPDILIEPPEPVEKSGIRKRMESALISAGRFTGKILGGAVGAAIALPIGLVMGAVIGTRAGTNTIDDKINRPLLEKYHQDSVRQFVKIEKPIGTPGYVVHNTIKNLTGSFELRDKALETLQDMTGFEFTEKAIKNLSGKITDPDRQGILRKLKGKKFLKEILIKGLEERSFTEKEIEDILFCTKNEVAAGRLETLKPLLNMRMSKGKFSKKLKEAQFNEQEIDVILGQADFTFREGLAKVIGGTAGAVTGTVLGTLGAIAVGYKWGSRFAGLFGANYVKEKLGEFPKHPETESILQRDYGEK